MKIAIRMDDKDFVATALTDVHKGDEVTISNAENVQLYTMTAIDEIPFGNKIALKDMRPGEIVIKYGAPIGECTHSISCGTLVHVHNVKSRTVDIPPAIRKEIMRQMKIEEAAE